MIDIIVIGGIHHNALGVIRGLGYERRLIERMLFIIWGTNKKSNLITASKFVNKDNVVSCENEDSLIGFLKVLDVERRKPVVVSCTDAVTEVLMKHRDELTGKFFLPGASIYPSKDVMSKTVQVQMAVEAGLNIPPSFEIETKIANHSNIDILYQSAYPCITKPITSVDGGKESIHIANSKEELITILQGIKSRRVQIQKYISKSLEFQLIGVSLKEGENVIIPGYTQLIRQPKNTNTGYLRYSPICQLNFDLSKIQKFIKSIGYSGLFSVEFLRDKEGNDYFMEINMRNDGNAYVVTKAGVNLPYLWYLYNTKGLIPEGQKICFEKSIYFMPELQDFKNVLNGSINLFKWLGQLWHTEAKAVWDLKDPAPFFRMMLNKVTKL